MNPQSVLIELLERVAARHGPAVLITDEELKQWPRSAVKAMKSQRLIAKASPASSAICPGCERDCVMPVHTLQAITGVSAFFIVCDKRSDINRVPVTAEKLLQWRCTIDFICRFIATCLELRANSPSRQPPEYHLFPLPSASNHARNCVFSSHLEAGKGGKCGAPRDTVPMGHILQITNADFVAAVFPFLPEGALAAICSKSGDPGLGGWSASRADQVAVNLSAENNPTTQDIIISS